MVGFMRFSLHATVILALLLPVMATAQSGIPAVTQLQATYDGTQVTVKWNAIAGTDIAYYRVYHSTTSILENDGLYDDFERTKGPETEITIVPPPGEGSFYAAVLAVSQSGQESPYFLEEASVRTGGGPASSQAPVTPTPPSSQVSSAPSSEGPTLTVLKGEAVSPEQINVTFSGPVTVDAGKAPQSLKILGQNGASLRIVKITILGNIISIFTEKQTKGAVYNVQFSEPFRGTTGKKLDPTDRAIFVTGHPEGGDSVAAPTIRESNPYAPPDVMTASITPLVQPNGLYALTAEWTVDNAPKDLVYLVVYQTRDGQTFGPPSVLPVDIRGVQLQDVTPGFFGLFIQTVNIYGNLSPGVFHYVSLPPFYPGQGLRGELLFGELRMNDMVGGAPELQTPNFDAVEPATAESEGLTTIAPMESPLMHASADSSSLRLDWKHAGILAGIVAAGLIFVISMITVMGKCCRSKKE